jgi:hypothetical protein
MWITMALATLGGLVLMAIDGRASEAGSGEAT